MQAVRYGRQQPVRRAAESTPGAPAEGETGTGTTRFSARTHTSGPGCGRLAPAHAHRGAHGDSEEAGRDDGPARGRSVPRGSLVDVANVRFRRRHHPPTRFSGVRTEDLCSLCGSSCVQFAHADRVHATTTTRPRRGGCGGSGGTCRDSRGMPARRLLLAACITVMLEGACLGLGEAREEHAGATVTPQHTRSSGSGWVSQGVRPPEPRENWA